MFAFITLSIVTAVAGSVLSLFDDQYDASGVVSVSIFAGAFGALVAVPATAILSLLIGLVFFRNGARTGERRDLDSSP